jgi:hypothetical protein
MIILSLIKHFPDLCRAFSARFEEHRTKQCEERKRQVVHEVRQATLIVHAQGVLPLSMVDNSAFSPNCLTIPTDPAYLAV